MFGIKIELPPPSIQFLYIKHFVAFFVEKNTYLYREEKMNSRSRDYTWFVDPCGDPYSNEFVALHLSATNELKMEYLRDEQNELRGVYEIERSFLNKLRQAMKRDPNLKLKFFVREGKGRLRRWAFEDRKRDSAKVKKVKEKLTEIKK